MLILSLNELCNYTNASPSSKNMIEGERILNAKFLNQCGATYKSDVQINIYASCVQTSHHADDPHTIRGILFINNVDLNNNDDEVNYMHIDRIHCSCRAGSSESCKHVVATLLFCNR